MVDNGIAQKWNLISNEYTMDYLATKLQLDTFKYVIRPPPPYLFVINVIFGA